MVIAGLESRGRLLPARVRGRQGPQAGQVDEPRATVARKPRPAKTPPPRPPGPSRQTRPPTTDRGADKLRDAVTAEGMFNISRRSRSIADRDGGNCASGFPGYDASACERHEQLSAGDIAPTTQVFDFVVFTETVAPVFNQTAPTPTTYELDNDEDARMSTS